MDIGANLLDEMFQGVYREKIMHAADLPQVLLRAKQCGARNIICTAGTLQDSKLALELVRQHHDEGFLRTTVGIHPTQASSHTEEEESLVFAEMLTLAREGMKDGCVVAIGECGLDRDRLHFAPFDVQLRVFEQHFALCEATKLPMFIHSRNCFEDMYEVLQKHPTIRGVVHSYDHESVEDTERLLKLNPSLYIGINGCSLKTEANLHVVKMLPLDRLMVESDAPWCGIRGTSAGAALLVDNDDTLLPKFVQVGKPERLKGREMENVLVKSRNEPCNTLEVLRVISTLKQLPLEQVCQQILENTLKLFTL